VAQPNVKLEGRKVYHFAQMVGGRAKRHVVLRRTNTLNGSHQPQSPESGSVIPRASRAALRIVLARYVSTREGRRVRIDDPALRQV